MKRIEIKNKASNKITHAAEFDDDAKMNAWKAQEIANNSWGKDDRWYTENLAKSLGLDITGKPTRILQGSFGEDIIQYFFEAEYTIIETDITSEVLDRKNKRDARNAKRLILRTLVGRSLTAAQQKQAIELILEILVNILEDER